METARQVAEIFITALAPIVATILVAALTKWMQKMGVDIEAKNRDALQSALANAATVAVRGRSISAGVEYVKSSVPDAVKKFGLPDHRIEELLAPHVTQATIAAAAASAATQSPGAL